MKKNIVISFRLTLVFVILCAGLYPLLISAVGKLTPGSGKGETVSADGRVVGYASVGQKFTDDKYFQGRPSAIDYNAAGSAGSNKGPSNAEYLKVVGERIDTFLVHNPTVKRASLPAELVTASGSGLDPDLSPAAAQVQVDRVATVRQVPREKVEQLVKQHTIQPLLGLLGPARINVLKLNIALDTIK